ncbi:hypothetical protein GOP47_0027956 [Adiantum capillus-veneris]|nr:hypothetical protein GOP47_0027956 [Adiantum capillus-veneris]
MMPIQVKASGYKYGCTGSDWAAWQGGTLLGKQLEDDESEVGESARSGRPARDVEHCEQRIIKGRGSLQEEGRLQNLSLSLSLCRFSAVQHATGRRSRGILWRDTLSLSLVLSLRAVKE